jgi:hypothetical protein
MAGPGNIGCAFTERPFEDDYQEARQNSYAPFLGSYEDFVAVRTGTSGATYAQSGESEKYVEYFKTGTLAYDLLSQKLIQNTLRFFGFNISTYAGGISMAGPDHKDDPNSYYMFPNISSAQEFMNRNESRDKEFFFYITDDRKVMVGPWKGSRRREDGAIEPDPRLFERFNKNIKKPQVLYGGQYHNIVYFGHSHPKHTNPKPSKPEDTEVHRYFNDNFGVQTLIYFDNNFYIYFLDGKFGPFNPNL